MFSKLLSAKSYQSIQLNQKQQLRRLFDQYLPFCSIRTIVIIIQSMQRTKEEYVFQFVKSSKTLLDKYQIINLIGQGCFGKIYKVYSKKRDQEVALKIQLKKGSNEIFLKFQYEKLSYLQGISGVPRVFEYGQFQNGYFMEMELLGEELNTQKKYTIAQLTQLTVQMIGILEQIHNRGVIHQDLKPQNIMTSLSEANKFYLIDFGLSKIQNRNDRYKVIRGFIGTPRYASLAAHERKCQTKADDLESLLYNIAYLYYKKLPWSKLHIESDIRFQRIKLMKMHTREKLFAEMDTSFSKAFQYINSLQRYQRPNYKLLIGCFKRHKTLIQRSNVDPETVRKQNKRYSMNNNNFLQVPENPFKGKNLKSQTGKNDSQTMSKSNSSRKSDDLIVNLIYPKQILEETYQVISTGQQAQIVANRTKTMKCNLYMKNPFQNNV